MHSKNDTAGITGIPPTGELSRAMSAQEFAALGADSIVFRRPITGAELAAFVPQARIAPDDAVFSMIMAADGAPVLVTDNDEAIAEWLDENEVTLVTRH